jgi:hypothetical protein
MKASAWRIVREADRETALIPAGSDTWHPLDGVPAPEYVPPFWIGSHCGLRLVQAFKTLAKMPMSFGPRFGSGYWPHYRHEWEDLLAQEEAAKDDKQLRAEAFNRVRIPPTAVEVGNMETAIVWPARYLAARPLIMRVVHRVAAGRARGQEMDVMAQRMRCPPARLRTINRAGLDLIADGLRRDGVAVF